MRKLNAGVRLICLCLIVNLTAGCGVELAMLASAASAASSGSAVYKQGKLNASWMAPFDLVVAAGQGAFKEMGMTVKKSTGDKDKGTWTIVAVDDDKDKITLTVNRATPKLTEFQIDVGWFGRESTARLLHKRMALAINLADSRDGMH